MNGIKNFYYYCTNENSIALNFIRIAAQFPN